MRTGHLWFVPFTCLSALAAWACQAPERDFADFSGDDKDDADAGGAPGDSDGTGGSSWTVSAPTTGLVVLGAETTDGERVLSVLSASNGQELLREPLRTAALAYDEKRFRWYVFTAAQFPAAQDGTADLEVREYSDEFREWRTVGKATALPPPIPGGVVVLNDRLVYLSYEVVADVPVTSLTLLDISDPTDIVQLDSRTPGTDRVFVGVAGARGSDVDPEASGGRVKVMASQNCTGTDCELHVQPLSVGNTLVNGVGFASGTYTGTPRFAPSGDEDTFFTALRQVSPSRLAVFPVSTAAGTVLSFPADWTGSAVAGFGVLKCSDAAVVALSDDQRLAVLDLNSSNVDSVDLGHTGEFVAVEPFTKSAIAFRSGLPADEAHLSSFQIERLSSTTLSIAQRSTWQPPVDLVPQTVATRLPESADCP
ncbi:MAG TPA: hypothetical protein VLC09_07980 [Polyangiaceae bacterium]|nr:hypothetical protein [Polyangiaceae bacterium]